MPSFSVIRVLHLDSTAVHSLAALAGSRQGLVCNDYLAFGAMQFTLTPNLSISAFSITVKDAIPALAAP